MGKMVSYTRENTIFTFCLFYLNKKLWSWEEHYSHTSMACDQNYLICYNATTTKITLELALAFTLLRKKPFYHQFLNILKWYKAPLKFFMHPNAFLKVPKSTCFFLNQVEATFSKKWRSTRRRLTSGDLSSQIKLQITHYQITLICDFSNTKS